jgi:putative transposase
MPTKSELKYHIVWCTKYRRKVLTDVIQESLKTLILEKATELDYKIEAMETMEDHIHIFTQASVKDSVHRIVSQLKGYTSFKLREEFPELKSRLPCMWTRSYYAGSVGHVSEATVKKYIENQKNV